LQHNGEVRIALASEQMPSLLSLLQVGVPVQGYVGISVEQFLNGLFQIPRTYIDNRIQTILLDGKPVDDLDVTIQGDSVLALSAAMPGLVGTTLRRGGHLAAFRKEITFQDRHDAIDTHLDRVTIKFFNALIRELGLALLRSGICMAERDLRDTLAWLAGRFAPSHILADINGKLRSLGEFLADQMLPTDTADRLWILQIAQKAE